MLQVVLAAFFWFLALVWGLGSRVFLFLVFIGKNGLPTISIGCGCFTKVELSMPFERSNGLRGASKSSGLCSSKLRVLRQN